VRDGGVQDKTTPDMMAAMRRSFLLTLRVLGGAVALASGVLGALGTPGCGGSAPTQIQARDQATTYVCDYYQRCAMIGAGQTYTSRDDCETKVRTMFQSAWPPEECAKISAMGFDNCLTAIRIAECNNTADVLNVLLNKCTKMNVCGTP